MAEGDRILLVDDDVDFVRSTRMILENAGHEVIVAYDGEEALAKAREFYPKLIILDIIMPTRNGFDTCSQLKRDPELASIPVLMLTSLSAQLGETSFSVTQGLQMEADDFIDKPVRPSELLLRVDKLLGRSQTI